MIIIKIGIFCLNIIFSIMKCLPVQKKITYISRQMNTIPKDFQMTIDNFYQKDKSYKHIVLAKMIPDSLIGKIGYCFHIFRQMYHIVTSRAVILDTYCIPISILRQREELIVIQMWHALGAFKKFGYSILDQEEGSSSKMAHLMKMHYHYSYVLSSSDFTVPYFAEAFHIDQQKVKVFPLPKTDLLLDKHERKSIIDKIYQCYPILKDSEKKVIVYAPTFRKEDEYLKNTILQLINKVDLNQYIFVLKLHPLTSFSIHDSRIIEDKQFSSLEFFHVADMIITDYSAVLFEASLLNKPLYFYAFDYQSYIEKRNFYIDYQTMLPGPICYNVDELIEHIQQQTSYIDDIKKFSQLMIQNAKITYTDDFVNFLRDELIQE